MKVKFISDDKYLEITEVYSDEDVQLLNNITSAIPIKWVNKRPTEMPPISYLQLRSPNYYTPAGLWYRFYQEKQKGANIQFLNNMKFEKEITEEFIADYINGLGLVFNEMAEHQVKAVYTALKFRETAVSVGTSGGKTFIAYCLAHLILRKTNFSPDAKYLVIVPSQMLCIQGFNDFEEFQQTQDPEDRKLKVHTIYSGAKNVYSFKEANVVFSTYQSLKTFTEIETWFDPFTTGVFIDEGHKAIDAVKAILKHLPKELKYKNAFSGSFEGPHTVAMLNIEAFVGPHLYQFKTAKLRDAGFTSDFAIIPVKIVHKAEDTRAYFEMLVHEYKIRKVYEQLMNIVVEIQKKRIKLVSRGHTIMTLPELVEAFKKGQLEYIHESTFDIMKQKIIELHDQGANEEFNRRFAEEEFLFSAHKRHKAIATMISKLNRNTLVLSRRRNDVKGLYDAGVQYATNKTCHLIMGGISNKNKQGAIDEVKGDEDFTKHVVFGNVDMIGTGTSIKSLFFAVFAGIGKSTANTIQTVGRMIRKFHAKKKSYIFDTYDVFECDVEGVPSHWKKTYSQNHFKERVIIYEREDYETIKSKEQTIIAE